MVAEVLWILVKPSVTDPKNVCNLSLQYVIQNLNPSLFLVLSLSLTLPLPLSHSLQTGSVHIQVNPHKAHTTYNGPL